MYVDPRLTPCSRDDCAWLHCLKPKYDEPFSKFGHNFNLRRYTKILNTPLNMLKRWFTGAAAAPAAPVPSAKAD